MHFAPRSILALLVWMLFFAAGTTLASDASCLPSSGHKIRLPTTRDCGVLIDLVRNDVDSCTTIPSNTYLIVAHGTCSMRVFNLHPSKCIEACKGDLVDSLEKIRTKCTANSREGFLHSSEVPMTFTIFGVEAAELPQPTYSLQLMKGAQLVLEL